MALERSGPTDITTSIPRERFTRPRSPVELFDAIIRAGKTKAKMDPLLFMQEFVDTLGMRAQAENHASVDPAKPLVIVPNHFHNPQLSRVSTVESMKNISLVTDEAFQLGVARRHVAWFIKQDLKVYPLPTPGMKARRAQNAAPAVFDYIGVSVAYDKVLQKDIISNPEELAASYARAKERGSAIGYFPEQVPSTTLKRPHSNFKHFIFLTPAIFGQDVQFVPASVKFSEKEAEVHYGKVVTVNKSVTKQEAAELSEHLMSQIAAPLPKSMRGPYA